MGGDVSLFEPIDMMGGGLWEKDTFPRTEFLRSDYSDFITT